MKVCFNLADQSFGKTKSVGIYNVSLGLIEGLGRCPGVRELVVLTTPETREVVEARGAVGGGRVRCVDVLGAPPGGASRVWWDQVGVVEAADRTGADWLVLPKGFPPLVRWPRMKVCCYVHDNVFGYYAARGWKAFPWFERVYFPAELRRAARRADLVVTNSAFTASEVAALGRTRPTEVVGIGFERLEVLAPPVPAGGRGSVLLLVSDQRHKLTAQAVEWVERWRRSSAAADGRQVVSVGRLPAGVACPPAGGSGWTHHGRLPDSEFEEVWRRSRVLLYFSAYEGFGMPPLEAAMRGVAPLASDIPALRENVPAEFLFDNTSFDDFAAKLDRSLSAVAPPVFPVEEVGWDEVAGRLVNAMLPAGRAPS